MIERLIRVLKKDPNYKWNNKYSIYDLMIILFERGLQMLRGFFAKIFFKKSKGLLFVGSRVKIQHKHKIIVGSNFIISDNCQMNALSENGIRIGDNVSIGRNSILVCTGVVSHIGVGITIGNGTGINSGAYLSGQGGIVIGDNVIVGPGVKIFSENHVFSNLELNIKDQGVDRKQVVIENNCWIASGVTILAGVTIGEGCVVAAGAVVTKSFPDNSIIGGIPAKVIKTR